MFERYGWLGCFRLIISVIYTKFLHRKARLIRFPLDIRNRRFIKLGRGLTTGFGCRLEAFKIKGSPTPVIQFGDNVQINDYVHIACGESITIDNNVLIASKVFITDINHGNYTGENSDSPMSLPNSRILTTKPVLIEENVWIGENVCVLPGITIGMGSIIGAGSVVTKSIPPYSIAVGNPAKVVKKYDFDKREWKQLL